MGVILEEDVGVVTLCCFFVLCNSAENPCVCGTFVATRAGHGEYKRIEVCELIGSIFEETNVTNLEKPFGVVFQRMSMNSRRLIGPMRMGFQGLWGVSLTND